MPCSQRLSQRVLHQALQSIVIGSLSVFLTTLPLQAAERLFFIFNPLRLSLRIDSLETFAEEGRVNQELDFYMNLAGVNEEQKTLFREALRKRADIDPVQLSRFFRTPTGEAILEKVGNLIAIQGGRNGKFALRGAMVQAALDKEEGLTLLNLLRHLPVNMQFNLEEIFQLANYVDLLGRATTALVEEMKQISIQEAQQGTATDFTSLPDIRQPGPYGVAPPQVLKLNDDRRQREVEVLLVQPQRFREGKTPVVIFSHGLGSRPEDFEDRAKQLASYGYVVALPQHRGSDFQQVQDLLQGFSRDLFKLSEFVDRPQDISFVIDELERRNERQFGGRLDLENVGVMGHSFGGYAALAVGGATIDFEGLEQTCQRQIVGPNASLLLQCGALALPRQTYNFRDERVKAALVINPVTSSIFGEKGLSQVKIPVAIGAGSNDPATPAVIEQLKAFVLINTSDKYFALVEGQAHVNFSKLDASVKALIDSFPDLVLPQQSVIDSYGSALLVAFSEVHIAKNEAFSPFLTAAYGQYISQDPNPLHLVEADAEVPLSELFNRFKTSEMPAIFPRGVRPDN